MHIFVNSVYLIHCKYLAGYICNKLYCKVSEVYSAFSAADKLEFGVFHRFSYHRLEIELVLTVDNVLKNGASAGVLRREDRAAVLVRQYRGVESVDLAGYLDYLRFIHSDAGTEHGHTAGGVGADYRAHRLARDLSEALTRDKA